MSLGSEWSVLSSGPPWSSVTASAAAVAFVLSLMFSPPSSGAETNFAIEPRRALALTSPRERPSRYNASRASIAEAGIAPLSRSASLPPRNTIIVGMLWMP